MRVTVVVEDEPVILMLASGMLEDAGHVVTKFSNAAQAIVYCSDQANDLKLVFTDINMPGKLDGLDLARHMTLIRPEVPVLVTSGRYTELPVSIAGKIKFILKPWRHDALLALMKGMAP